jgi:hypothetical protein
MQPSDETRITDIWDEFADHGFIYVTEDGERRGRTERRKARHERLGVRQDLISDFLEQRIDLQTFKGEMGSECTSHQLWGFSGFSGQMFFNLLFEAADAVGAPDLSSVLRETISAPADQDAARSQIQTLVEYVNGIRDEADEDTSSPAAGYVPYFLSYFWQFDDPDRYPIYYKSMRDALSGLDLWSSTGDFGTDYVRFWELNEEIREVLEAHTDEQIHLWDIERLCLFWLNRDEVSLPDVWVEKARPTEWNYGDPGSGFGYGEALWTPQVDTEGRRIFEALREPAVGDIVLHLSSEDGEIVGTSVVDSELQTEFDPPEGVTWDEAQRERGGYLRELSDYRELTPPFDIDEDLLGVAELESTLERIAEEYSVFYRDSLRLAPQAYLTKAPRELVEVLARQSPSLRDRLAELGYHIKVVEPAGEYENISNATDDVRARIADQDATNPLRSLIASSLIEEWTTMLSGFEQNHSYSVKPMSNIYTTSDAPR